MCTDKALLTTKAHTPMSNGYLPQSTLDQQPRADAPTIPANLDVPLDLTAHIERVQGSLSNLDHPQRSIIAGHSNEICHVISAENCGDGFRETQHQVELMRAAFALQKQPLGVSLRNDGRLAPFLCIVNFAGERYIFHSNQHDAIHSLTVTSMILQIGPLRATAMHASLEQLTRIVEDARKEVDTSAQNDVCLILFYSIPKYADLVQARYWELRLFSRHSKATENASPPYRLTEYGVCATSQDAGSLTRIGMFTSDSSTLDVVIDEAYDAGTLRVASKAYTVYDLDVRIKDDHAPTFNQFEQMRLKLVITQKLLQDGLSERDRRIEVAEQAANEASAGRLLDAESHCAAIKQLHSELDRTTHAKDKLRHAHDKQSEAFHRAKMEIQLQFKKNGEERAKLQAMVSEKEQFATLLCEKEEELQTLHKQLADEREAHAVEKARANAAIDELAQQNTQHESRLNAQEEKLKEVASMQDTIDAQRITLQKQDALIAELREQFDTLRRASEEMLQHSMTATMQTETERATSPIQSVQSVQSIQRLSFSSSGSSSMQPEEHKERRSRRSKQRAVNTNEVIAPQSVSTCNSPTTTLSTICATAPTMVLQPPVQIATSPPATSNFVLPSPPTMYNLQCHSPHSPHSPHSSPVGDSSNMMWMESRLAALETMLCNTTQTSMNNVAPWYGEFYPDQDAQSHAQACNYGYYPIGVHHAVPPSMQPHASNGAYMRPISPNTKRNTYGRYARQ